MSRNVLIADSNKDRLVALSEAVTQRGWEVTRVELGSECVEHAAGCCIDGGCQCRLDAALQQQHGPRVFSKVSCRPTFGARWYATGNGRGQYRQQQLAQPQGGIEQRPAGKALAQQPALQALQRRARLAPLELFAADIQQPVVLHA